METLKIKDRYSETVFVLHGDEVELARKLCINLPSVCRMGKDLETMLSELDELGRFDVDYSGEEDDSEPLRLEVPMEWVYANDMERRGE